MREGTDGPTAEKGSKVAIFWRFKISEEEPCIEKSGTNGQQFKLDDPDDWPYQMIGQKKGCVLELLVN